MRRVDIKKGAPLSPNLVNLKSNTMKNIAKIRISAIIAKYLS